MAIQRSIRSRLFSVNIKDIFNSCISISSIGVIKDIAKIAIPEALNQIISTSELNLIFLITSVKGTQSQLSALGSVVYLIWFLISLIYFGMTGISSLTSKAWGIEDKDEISNITFNGTLAMLAVYLLCIPIILLLKSGLLIFMNLPADETELVSELLPPILIAYMFRIPMWGFLGTFLGMGLTSHNTLIVLSYIPLESLLLYLSFSKLGFSQAVPLAIAIASIIGSTTGYIIFLYRIGHIYLKPQLSLMLRIAKIGIPMSLTSLVFSGIYVVMLPIISSQGSYNLAGISLGQRIETVIWVLGAGAYSTALALTGQFTARREREKLENYLRAILWLSFIIYLPLEISVIFISTSILKHITPDIHTLISSYSYLGYTAIFGFFMILEMIASAVLIALENTTPYMLVRVTCDILRPFLAVLLIKPLNSDGIWLSINLSNLFAGLILTLLAIRELKKKALLKD